MKIETFQKVVDDLNIILVKLKLDETVDHNLISKASVSMSEASKEMLHELSDFDIGDVSLPDSWDSWD